MSDEPTKSADDIARDRLFSADGPVILWEYNGFEGWSPKSFDTVKEALEYQRWESRFVITRKVNYEIVEIDDPKGETS